MTSIAQQQEQYVFGVEYKLSPAAAARVIFHPWEIALPE
jgi:hypothetical protein